MDTNSTIFQDKKRTCTKLSSFFNQELTTEDGQVVTLLQLVTVSNIAKVSGVSRPVLYRFFEGRHDTVSLETLSKLEKVVLLLSNLGSYTAQPF